MEKSEQRLLQNVVFDIGTISQWNTSINDGVLRQGSVILRRLLLYGEYGQAWRTAGFVREPKILQTDSQDFVGNVPEGAQVKASIGVAGKSGSIFAIQNMPDSVDPQAFIQSLLERAQNQEIQELPLSKYLSKICLIINEEKISRRDIIKFVAN